MNGGQQAGDSVMLFIDEGSPINEVIFSTIQDPLRWSPIEMLQLRDADRASHRLLPDDAWWASRDVQGAHDRFRRCYLGNGRSMSLCRCMAHVDPHLHAPRKLRRIGHLPMMTMKELPE